MSERNSVSTSREKPFAASLPITASSHSQLHRASIHEHLQGNLEEGLPWAPDDLCGLLKSALGSLT